ncbi:hypothetical protein C731_1202 [Mycolicibacterium hassiacum DSM 44199]|uniref:Uncharacterized protein n=1 Tax=Mycolicibacterium hassiacum (strain DSM 44199 / CIP 105218 / JCM 12690 / 3849) TaxID=1122247 RepID=K5B936_MYCHD|nr:hypothetical protein C731_1202 [Mycolicibacterium hassiacum DSM 44199]
MTDGLRLRFLRSSPDALNRRAGRDPRTIGHLGLAVDRSTG